LDRIPYRKLIRGVIIVSRRDANEVVKFLRKFDAEIHVREVVLTPQDEKALKTEKCVYTEE
jgi:hypothetical protein